MKTISERINPPIWERARCAPLANSLLTQREPDLLAERVMDNPESSKFVEVGPEEELSVSFCSVWRHILVPLTFDDASRAALKFASGLAGRFDSEIALLYADELAASARALQAEAELWRQFSWIRTRHPTARLFLHPGQSYDQIMAAAKSTNADLIVMSSDYYRQFLSYLVQAHKTCPRVHSFPCPVVLVKYEISGLGGPVPSR